MDTVLDPLVLLCCEKGTNIILLRDNNFSTNYNLFMFEFPCIITLYYIKNQQDATLAVLFISHCKITLYVSKAFCVHLQEY